MAYDGYRVRFDGDAQRASPVSPYGSRVDLRDRGATFIEMLISIVLLGIVVIGVLAAVRTTVIATAIEREHARAGQWLESGAKAIETAPFGNCSVVDGVAQSSFDAQQTYNDAVRAAPVPEGWSVDQISVAADIDVWDGGMWIPYSSTTACYDDTGLRLQRVLLTVENPNGDIIETLEVVKRG